MNKKKILVVDNNPLFLKLMSELFLRNNHDVTCVINELNCLDILTELTPDIIFLDLIMSRMGGEDLCRVIRNRDHLQECHIIIVSASIIESEIDFQEIGADGCIAKGPFKQMSEHLLQAVADSENPRQQTGTPATKGKDTLHFRQITKELLDQNQHLKVILESMSQGILEIDLGRVVYINPRGERILGVQRNNILGTRISSTLPLAFLNEIQDKEEGFVVKRTSEDCAPIQIGDKQITFELFCIGANNKNQLIMLSDITERKKMEAVIEATNLTENLGYVFSGLRHEIGNPVNSIKVALSVLQKNIEEYDRETIAEFLDRTLQEVSRIEYLLKALKNYSLFESPVMQKMSSIQFFEDFFPLIKEDFENRNIRLQPIIPSEDIELWADSRALHHVMLNLLTNAADALTDCERPQIVVSVTREGKWVKIKVDDNGKGIPDIDQRNLFKPFFTSKISGTGLGLVIVKKMLLAMHGDIVLESYKGLGTTATILLAREENGWQTT